MTEPCEFYNFQELSLLDLVIFFQLWATPFPICTWKPYVIINSLCIFWRKYVLLLKESQLCHLSGKPFVSTAKWLSLYLLCFESGYKLAVKWNGGILFFKLLPFLSLKPFTWINWGKLVAFAERSDQISVCPQPLPHPGTCAVQHCDLLKWSRALHSFLSSLSMLMQYRPFSREFTLQGKARSLHNAHCGELTPDVNPAFHLRLPLQRVFSFPSPQKQILYFHFFAASRNVIWVPLSPGGPEGRQPSLTTARGHQHLLGTILWGRTDGEKEMRPKLTGSGSHTSRASGSGRGLVQTQPAKGFRPESFWFP